MTHFTVRNLPHTAVYWGNPQNDGYGGFTYPDDPVELNCRWEDVAMVGLGPKTIDYEVRSEVTLAQDVDECGMMLLGTLDDLDSDQYHDPAAAGAHMIVRFNKIPNIKGNQYYRKAYLGKLWTGKT